MEHLLKVITTLKLPFRAVENPHWRRLCHLLNPAFKLPSHKTLREHLLKRVKEVEEELKQQLSKASQIPLSVDCWSNTQRQSFMAINAYWIDEKFQYQSALIGFESLEGDHSGSELAKVLISVFQRYNIHDKIQTITSDNASNNTTLVMETNKAIDQLPTRYKTLFPQPITRIPCLSHVIQLSLQALLGAVRIDPKNEDFQRNWNDLDMEVNEHGEIPITLAKVYYLCNLH
jgi:hypothetical protein